jgi:hypothetical protein
MIGVSYVAGGGTPGTSGMAFSRPKGIILGGGENKDKELPAVWVSVSVMKMLFL